MMFQRLAKFDSLVVFAFFIFCMLSVTQGCIQSSAAEAVQTAASATDDPADWCAGHDVPESKCTLCNPELIPKYKASGDWCAEHGLPESICPPCNPEQPETAKASATLDWCAGHGVPESKCTICNPELIPTFKANGDWCAEHDLPESVCPACNPNQPESTAGTAPLDWCAGHGVPESQCTICNPELIPTFKANGDWCAEHDLPESVCPACNPNQPESTAGTAPLDWCAGHGVPESQCTICNPELIPTFKANGDWCAEHRLPESVCPTCNPGTLPPEAIEARVVRFVSPELEARAGIQTQPAAPGMVAEAIQCPAQFAFHGDQMADLRAVIPGVVRHIHVELGAQVVKGAPLFDLESAQIANAQAALRTAKERKRLAKNNLVRLKTLKQKGMSTARELELAEQELETATAEMTSAETELLVAGASGNDQRGRFTLTAPMDGTLIRRPAVIGTLATEETSLGMIADTSTMWAICDVPEKEADRLLHGAPVNLTVSRGQSYEGTISWIASEVDPRTRTVKVRAEVPNPDQRLRANQFAQARIETAAAPGTLLVPRNAVQRVGELNVVFVQRKPGMYEPRVVSVFSSGDRVSVAGRLQPGDEVVTTGAVLLRTEVLPGSIGAGCCEVEPLGGN